MKIKELKLKIREIIEKHVSNSWSYITFDVISRYTAISQIRRVYNKKYNDLPFCDVVSKHIPPCEGIAPNLTYTLSQSTMEKIVEKVRGDMESYHEEISKNDLQ